MPILLKRKSGEITPFRNADFIPAFYFIPKSILDKCGSELNSIPRNPKKLLQSWDRIAMVESNLFLLAKSTLMHLWSGPLWDWVQSVKSIPVMNHLGFTPTQHHIGFRKCRRKRFFRQQRTY